MDKTQDSAAGILWSNVEDADLGVNLPPGGGKDSGLRVFIPCLFRVAFGRPTLPWCCLIGRRPLMDHFGPTSCVLVSPCRLSLIPADLGQAASVIPVKRLFQSGKKKCCLAGR